MRTHASLIIDPGTWDGIYPCFCPWWTKFKLQALTQMRIDYTKEGIGQALCTHMAGDAEGFTLQTLKQYNENGWLKWEDETIGTEEDAITTIGLKNIVERCFMEGDCPEAFLKQLRELKQENKDMKDFLTEFKYLKALSNISDNHIKEILQQNIKWVMMEQFVTCYGPPVSYDDLKKNLVDCGESECYLKAIKCPKHFSQYHIPTSHKPQPKPIKYLSGQRPMDVDPKPPTKDKCICYNHGKVGHIARNYKVRKSA